MLSKILFFVWNSFYCWIKKCQLKYFLYHSFIFIICLVLREIKQPTYIIAWQYLWHNRNICLSEHNSWFIREYWAFIIPRYARDDKCPIFPYESLIMFWKTKISITSLYCPPIMYVNRYFRDVYPWYHCKGCSREGQDQDRGQALVTFQLRDVTVSLHL